ncbi:MAG: hypothetical protein K5745_06275, partial [Saccharofermentans sp.]|nr:hypothetical protein [Saccharofermentans sp.]
AIGSGAYYITMMFPSIDEASSEYIDDFTAEELSEYDIIYLDGFDYHDCETAESLIRQVAQNGTEVIVFADGIPENESSRTNRFLGVEAQPITFDNGYPTLQTADGRFYEIPLFPDEYKDWSTCYINGLTDVKGWAEILGETLPFYGTIDCENITFLAYNLTYYYSLTRDRNVGEILADIIPEPEHDIPVRQIVPLEIEYGHNDITITSPEDNVNTTVTEHDIFEGEFDTHKRMVFAGEGTTVINMHYPHLAMSILMSVAGLAITISGSILAGKRKVNEDSNNNPVS